MRWMLMSLVVACGSPEEAEVPVAPPMCGIPAPPLPCPTEITTMDVTRTEGPDRVDVRTWADDGLITRLESDEAPFDGSDAVWEWTYDAQRRVRTESVTAGRSTDMRTHRWIDRERTTEHWVDDHTDDQWDAIESFTRDARGFYERYRADEDADGVWDRELRWQRDDRGEILVEEVDEGADGVVDWVVTIERDAWGRMMSWGQDFLDGGDIFDQYVRDENGCAIEQLRTEVGGPVDRVNYTFDERLLPLSMTVDNDDDGEIDALQTYTWDGQTALIVDEQPPGDVWQARELVFTDDFRALEDKLGTRPGEWIETYTLDGDCLP